MKDKMVAIAGVVFFVLFFLNIITMLYFYKQYNAKLNVLSQDHWLVKVKVENMEKDAEAFKGTADSWNNQIRGFDQAMAELSKKAAAGEAGIAELAAKLQGINDWQKRYGADVESITDIKGKTEALLIDVDQLKKSTVGNVNLGKIAVKGAPEPDRN